LPEPTLTHTTRFRLRDVVLEAKHERGMDKKSFAAHATAQTREKPLEKALLFRVWSMYERSGTDGDDDDGSEAAQEGAEREKEKENENGDGVNEGDEDEDDNKLALIRQEVIETIVKNSSKRPLFEKARVLAGNITYKTYIEAYKLSRSKTTKHVEE
jgi:hypothetical protein